MNINGAAPTMDRPSSKGWPARAFRSLAQAFGLGTPNPQTSENTSKKDITMNIQTDIKADNGVNVDALLGAREAITGMPAAGQFTWRAMCEWQTGTHSRNTIEGFFGLGEEQDRGATFTIDADHPAQFAAENAGATPLELALSAANCAG